MDKKQAIIVVKVLSIAGCIFSGLETLAVFITTSMVVLLNIGFVGKVSILGLLLFLLILSFFIFLFVASIGLWKHKNWARIYWLVSSWIFVLTTVIILILQKFTLPLGLFQYTSGLGSFDWISIIMSAVFIYCLMLNKVVKKLFK